MTKEARPNRRAANPPARGGRHESAEARFVPPPAKAVVDSRLRGNDGTGKGGGKPDVDKPRGAAAIPGV